MNNDCSLSALPSSQHPLQQKQKSLTSWNTVILVLAALLVVLMPVARPAAAQTYPPNTMGYWHFQFGTGPSGGGTSIYRYPGSPGYTYQLNVSAAPGFVFNTNNTTMGSNPTNFIVTLPVDATYPEGTKFTYTVSSNTDPGFGVFTTYAYSKMALPGPSPYNYLQGTLSSSSVLGSGRLVLGIGLTAMGGTFPYTIGVKDPVTGSIVFNQTFYSGSPAGGSFGPEVTLPNNKDYLWGCVQGSSISVSDCTHPVHIPSVP